MAIKLHSSFAVHPGAWLKTELLDTRSVAVGRLAEHFHVSRQALSAVLNGRAALTADMAIRFEKAFGVKADTLYRMQTAYDLAQARAHQDEIQVDPIAELA
jgi:addiction module HigA family antidote